MSERLTRKQLKEDHFVEFIAKAAAYTRENTVVVVIAVVVITIVVLRTVIVGLLPLCVRRVALTAAGREEPDSEEQKAESQ